MIEAKLTPSERKFKDLFEKVGIRVLKGSYPDFILKDEKTGKYCLVEIKCKNGKESDKQKETQAFLKRLNIPVVTVHEGSLSDYALLAKELGRVSTNPKQYLSKKEVERYAALADADTIKHAALKLGIATQTLYSWMGYIKKRYRRHRGWVNDTLAQTRRGGLLANLLKERRQMLPLELEDLEEEGELSHDK